MAMAYLFQQLREEPSAPRFDLTALVVDHGHRPDSKHEASLVSQRLEKLGIRARVNSIHWLGAGFKSTRFETEARKFRYQHLGATCVEEGITHLFLGQHQDDQIETILLQQIKDVHGQQLALGMRPLSTIPCCSDLFGVGCDANRDYKPISLKITPARLPVTYPGIKIYRPLLEFPKSRLVATCDENQISYVSDPSNQDPTCTARNALRVVLSTNEIPRALKQESLTRLSLVAERKRQVSDDMVSKLLAATCVRRFSPFAGVLTVTPPVDVAQDPVCSIDHVVSYLGRLLEVVSPKHTSRRSDRENMQGLAAWMLSQPGKSSDSSCWTARGVWIQYEHDGCCFSLSRQPFTAEEIRTGPTFPFFAHDKQTNQDSSNRIQTKQMWSDWILWDARYWIRIGGPHSQDVARCGIRSLAIEDLRRYYDCGLNSLRERNKTRGILADWAPGKSRYTLPVLTWRDEAFALPTMNRPIPSWAVAVDSHICKKVVWEVKYKPVAETLQQLNGLYEPSHRLPLGHH